MTGLNGAHLLGLAVLALAFFAVWSSSVAARMPGASHHTGLTGSDKATGADGRLDLHAASIPHADATGNWNHKENFQ